MARRDKWHVNKVPGTGTRRGAWGNIAGYQSHGTRIGCHMQPARTPNTDGDTYTQTHTHPTHHRHLFDTVQQLCSIGTPFHDASCLPSRPSCMLCKNGSATATATWVFLHIHHSSTTHTATQPTVHERSDTCGRCHSMGNRQTRARQRARSAV